MCFSTHVIVAFSQVLRKLFTARRVLGETCKRSLHSSFEQLLALGMFHPQLIISSSVAIFHHSLFSSSHSLVRMLLVKSNTLRLHLPQASFLILCLFLFFPRIILIYSSAFHPSLPSSLPCVLAFPPLASLTLPLLHLLPFLVFLCLLCCVSVDALLFQLLFALTVMFCNCLRVALI